ncbi:uncharacterized protein LOC125216967 isoform X1 [Salvia hispanica]|uniref:uncharacterized protein LOC125216967 isoform X1 n=1 Tax=Salvia hispanica TaxID=49212 RepID=UPI002009D969|nr:uncharacterized protein LOC125216967 isoform X1 [Salvia hispanica]XP_047974720.1 uncharacterized protein LOC125216967 isoform X1 [Salvia hispanica]XP_047974721.1 uncharacterized protein LOC125216967 isoform X1 [Salvia hispanica]XP_047974722.1 uncharacterized protein LOC125216967 isoform X1 [Salvia hispanica]XP_047974723.1 uncharacterized protein LOC125216967 isoform X1 [Salvia hispanica]XP_047974724.1 uncharacterized protein LOC125216967 isoform X1 [Salvia hispanica]XP_047974725.1 uncharac
MYPPFVEERKFNTSWSSRLQLLKPKPKLADILLSYRDIHDREFFTSYSLVNNGDLSPQYYVYPPSFLAEQGYLFTGATSNGVLHFHNKDLGSHALWNLLTGEYKILPKHFVDELSPSVCFGFTMWSDHESQDCKLMYLVDVISISEQGDLDRFYHFVLYSLKTNSWRLIPFTGFDLVEVFDGYGCVSGGFYCVAYRKESGECILSFDISTETFSTLPTPNDYSYDTRYDFLEYKGYLCIIENEGYNLRMPRLWVLGDDGLWMRESFFDTIGVGWPLWSSYDGNLLYFPSLVDDALVVFDCATGVLVVYHEVKCSSMVPFSQSLTQLNKL